MSKPIPKEGIVHLPPDEQVAAFAGLFRGAVGAEALARFEARCAALGLRFDAGELAVLAALDTPDKVQAFLDTHLYYNDDHASVDQEETAMPPKLVLRTGMAHCFEGAMFAYAVNFLHGHEPRLLMLEASQDADHNLVVCRDPRTGLWGANAQSRYPGLVGRPAEYPSLRALADSYIPFYFSDRTLDPTDLTLVGYSEPIDLTAKFGTDWMASEGAPLGHLLHLRRRERPFPLFLRRSRPTASLPGRPGPLRELDPARRGGRALRQPGRPPARSARGVGRLLEGLRSGSRRTAAAAAWPARSRSAFSA